ncbi:MAG: PKD domain-containing protein, partial [Bacteroidota bacterium]
PTTAQSAQPNFGGGAQDAIAFKLSPNLDNLIWSTFLGGSGADAAYGVQFDQNSDAYITGGTVSQDFPTTPNALNPSHQGGTDGFIVHLNNAGSSILAATYLGTPSYDQCYFVQLDFADNVYVVGQTQGNYPVTAGVYNNPNSGQFIHKLQPGLAATDFSLVFGSGQGDIDISPSAFLVNSCGHILVSGWGGVTNQPPNGLAANSSTLGMPTTSGGFQPNPPNGSDFYFMVLDTNAVGLLFGTFFGGGNTNEHVDGGTSRFDKKGVIYQAVCAGCGFSANPQFPTTAGSWSPSQPINPMNNLNVNCNLAVIKYDLITLEAIAQTNGPPVVCVNDTIDFSNLSLGGQNFAWDFDDGNTSSDFEPAHAFTAPGTYTVMLAIQDSVSCIKQDTDFVTITVLPPPVAQVGFIQPICPGDSVQLFASGGTSYSWSPAGGLNRTDIPNPTAGPSSSRTYRVTVSDSCGMDIDSVRVIVREDPTDIMNDTAICNGQFVTLQASGGISYSWSPVQFLDKPGTQFPVARPDTSVQFTVSIIDSNGCSWTQQVWVFVEEGTPDVITWGDTAICPSGEAQIHASGGFEFTWEPITGLNDPTVNHPVARPEETTVYVVEVSNACGLKRDSVVVEVRGVTLEATGDTIVCPGQQVALSAVGTGGTLYRWVPEASVQNPVALNTIATPQVPTTYIITAVNDIGCSEQDSVFVEIAPDPFLEIDAADTVLGLDPLTLVVLGNGSLTWSPDYNISCLDCPEVTVFPDVPTTYRVDLVDDNGCTNFDFIHVDVFPSIYIPNAFTPGDGNANNPVFRAYGERIIGFEMVIFDRWGRVLFESFNLEDGWDGTYRNGGGEVP